MTKIKTAQAWGALTPDGRVYPLAISTKDGRYKQQIVIVHGLTEAEVHEAAALLAPDPRVAVLDRLGLLTLDQIEAVLVCAKAAVRASKTEGGIIITEDVTAVIDSIIAAQRGEVASQLAPGPRVAASEPHKT